MSSVYLKAEKRYFCKKSKRLFYFATMYTRQEASVIRKKFWTSFGQYMKPIVSASGEKVNWLNYKTGVKYLYFRMDVDNKKASVAIELRHPDTSEQQQYFEQLQELKNILEQSTREVWQWQLQYSDEDGNMVSRVFTSLNTINVYNPADWPVLISFLKPRIIALDQFWDLVKDGFE